MRNRSHHLGALVLSILTVATLTTSAFAGGVIMRCRGGANNGNSCSTDADCPGLCLHSATGALCGAGDPCARVCRGGDTPGAECPDGKCPGVCVGGDNRQQPCTGDQAECPGGYCNTECRQDKCKLGECKTGQSHSESSPLRADADDSWDDEESGLSACVATPAE
jgi:hypothetical protein